MTRPAADPAQVLSVNAGPFEPFAVPCDGVWRIGVNFGDGREKDEGSRPLLLMNAPADHESDEAMLGPVFQECHPHATNEEAALLLVGQFRRRHFAGALSASSRSVRLEIADRWARSLEITSHGLRVDMAAPAGGPDDAPAKVLFVGSRRLHFRWFGPSVRDAWTQRFSTGSDPTAPRGGQFLAMTLTPPRRPTPPLTITYGWELALGDESATPNPP